VSDRLEPLVQRCVDELQDALNRPPAELSDEVDRVEQQLARVRDVLIQRRHEAGALTDPAALHRVNGVLSLVVGVEYPSAGIQRKLLEQARDALSDLLAQQLLDRSA
jgi:hypothetical protein